MSKSAGIRKPENLEELPEPNVTIWPEWSESEVLSEKWASKHAYEDVDGPVYLPRSLRKLFESTKRACDIIGDTAAPIVVQPLSGMDELFYSQKPCPLTKLSTPFTAQPRGSVFVSPKSGIPEEEIPRFASTDFPPEPEKAETPLQTEQLAVVIGKERLISEGEEEKEIPMAEEVEEDTIFANGTSKLFQANKHLLHSEFMVSLLSALHYFYEHNKTLKTNGLQSDDPMPWENIYPKAKDGLPQYNSSGKYIVKLYWLGSWRKVTVDDKIPLDSQGRPLILSSCPINEIWPMILCKALLKVASLSYKEDPEQCEFGDFVIKTAIRGWVPERINILADQIVSLGSVMANFMTRRTMKPRMSSQSPVITPNTRSSSLALTHKYLLTGFVIFVYKKQSEFASDKFELNNLLIPYRLVDVQDSLDSSDGKLYQIRPYFSSGYKKNKGKPEEDCQEFIDQWISESELCSNFSHFTVFHPQYLFKNVKTISFVTDQTKNNETYRIPSLIYSPEGSNAADPGILIFLSTYGRENSVNSLPTLIFIEEYSWENPVKNQQVLRLKGNGYTSAYLKNVPGCGYRVVTENANNFTVTFLSKDDYIIEDETKFLVEKHGYKLREFEDHLPPQQPGAWSVLFKHILAVTEPTFYISNLYIPDSMQSSTIVRAINNDTGDELKQIGFQLYPQVFQPSKSGYTILAETRSLTGRPQAKWKFRLMSENITPTLSEKETVSTKMNIQDFTEAYAPNKHHILFRSVLKVKETPINNLSLQVSFSMQSIWIKIVLYDNDVEICSVQGKGLATINNVLLHQAEDPPPAKPSKDDKKGPAGAQSAPPAPILPKHKYVLQATILESEVDRLNQITSNSSNDPNRPTSRSSKSGSAASKKKKVNSASVTAGNQTPAPAVAVVAGTSPQATAPPSELEFFWSLRLISTDTSSVLVVKDTEKEDRYKAIKESWETAAPGRMNRARDNRENYLKHSDLGNIHPVNIILGDKINRTWNVLKKSCPKVLLTPKDTRPGTEPKPIALTKPLVYPYPTQPTVNYRTASAAASHSDNSDEHNSNVFHLTSKVVTHKIAEAPAVIFQNDFENNSKQRQKNIEVHNEKQGEIVKTRLAEKEKRALNKKYIIDAIDQKLHESEYWLKVDIEKRDGYRQRLIDEAEEINAKLKAAQDAASRAAELAAEQAAGEELMDKKKKAGKK
ncbi:hypothetical protein HDV01_000833 [Terramyces sp. JEL0728]|nr:hypothetical protein HDV01_000833 [Terramyces sp. JEL0728]